MRRCAEPFVRVVDGAGLRLRLRLLAGFLAVLPIASSAAEVAKITLADRTNVGTSELVLNGAGLRKKPLFRVCVADLYLTLLRVWVGDKPTSAGLKSALLGQAR